ncbi:hypothetical protein COCMIDRAFT_6433 [Bipolaris oryzae ATCC 44560]|uniref:Uncharacterized protein n=1 Tax=Bipolaris oryzae ATCC 44560 TaxID=930090 RepID=W6YXX1_COCMI|nr:uncharacterized protein COCMIDRAFT_6433 [Bipolaris oryzae ATCC 44560]EUC44187.1 hypothetical protein COCMIDRAFT_6433 [Bipolaris oryzae ATCC 44560]
MPTYVLTYCNTLSIVLGIPVRNKHPGCNGNNPQGEAAGSKVEGPRGSSLQVRGLGFCVTKISC